MKNRGHLLEWVKTSVALDGEIVPAEVAISPGHGHAGDRHNGPAIVMRHGRAWGGDLIVRHEIEIEVQVGVDAEVEVDVGVRVYGEYKTVTKTVAQRANKTVTKTVTNCFVLCPWRQAEMLRVLAPATELHQKLGAQALLSTSTHPNPTPLAAPAPVSAGDVVGGAVGLAAPGVPKDKGK